jgi:hypothetical protein
MWKRIIKENKTLAFWQKDGITEIYDSQALELNINKLKHRLEVDSELDEFNKELIKLSINHLEEGLKFV